MKKLVLTAKYPKNDGNYERMFVHVRNLFYKKKGIDVAVINFDTIENYYIDGIRVITKNTFKKENINYDLLVSHATNVRNQYLFLKQYNNKPSNLYWINRTMSHNEMFEYLDKSRCALLFTREDTQGVMTCELAAYGILVITFDIEVYHEFFEKMDNVELVSNDYIGDLEPISRKLIEKLPYKKDTTYFGENTINEEIELFQKIDE